MTWTSTFGRACGVLLQKIVDGLALTRISPNVLTFIGLVINIGAAIFFGYANSQNHVRMFFFAGLVILGAGIFDMVDGRVARQTDQVTVFGAFFDSVIDRYSDVAIFFGLLEHASQLVGHDGARRSATENQYAPHRRAPLSANPEPSSGTWINAEAARNVTRPKRTDARGVMRLTRRGREGFRGFFGRCR